MFIFYWGMLSSITPPVAIASFAAAGIAGAPAMRTGWESMWVGSIIYFIPFFFVAAPALVLQGPNPYPQAMMLTVEAIAGTFLICAGIQGYLTGMGDLRLARRMEWPLRVLLIFGGVALATPGGSFMPLSEFHMTMFGLAIVLPTLLLCWLLVRRRADAGAVVTHDATAMPARTIA